MRMAVFCLMLLVLSLPLRAADPIDPDVLTLREAAWRAWFAGDEAALRTMLPDDFLAIGTRGPEITNREQTIAESKGFKEAGGKLLTLSFPETKAQRFGDTVVLYGSYEATFVIDGKETKMAGRLTEVFVKRGGRWVHPGWHLDLR